MRNNTNHESASAAAGKKKIRLIAASLALIVVFASPTSFASSGNRVFALITGTSSGQNAQIATIIQDVVKIASARLKIDVDTKTLKEVSEIEKMTASGAGKPDMVLPLNFTEFQELKEKHGYRPFARYSMYGLQKTEFCFFVKESSNAKKPEDLKGKTLVTYSDNFNYYLLRRETGAPLNDYFNLTAVPDGSSGIYALALDKADGAFLTNVIVEYMRMTNPGPVKGLRKFGCSGEFPMPPMVVSSVDPDNLEAAVLAMLLKGDKDPAFAKYKQLLKMTKIKFFKTSDSDYVEHMKLFAQAKKNGWDREFDKWKATRGK